MEKYTRKQEEEIARMLKSFGEYMHRKTWVMTCDNDGIIGDFERKYHEMTPESIRNLVGEVPGTGKNKPSFKRVF